MPSFKPEVVIISPGTQAANNGNWHTAHRWSRFLATDFSVSIDTDWTGLGSSSPACLVALHARRSARALARFAEQYPDRPRVLVLTGTDLYRDIHSDPQAWQSLDRATRLVVLQPSGLLELHPAHRSKCDVIYQSAPVLKPCVPTRRSFDLVLVGHMRAEKDPETPMRALGLIDPRCRVRLFHIGAALDARYQRAAEDLSREDVRYRWLGPLPHAITRQRIKAARLLVISSLLEGGANVVIEAITSGVPVLASNISGNVGLLGRDYEGYFPAGDAQSLADLIHRAYNDPLYLDRLNRQCARRAPLFLPEREREEVIKLVHSALRAPLSLPEPG